MMVFCPSALPSFCPVPASRHALLSDPSPKMDPAHLGPTCWSTPTASSPSYIMSTQPSLEASTNRDIRALGEGRRNRLKPRMCGQTTPKAPAGSSLGDPSLSGVRPESHSESYQRSLSRGSMAGVKPEKPREMTKPSDLSQGERETPQPWKIQEAKPGWVWGTNQQR